MTEMVSRFWWEDGGQDLVEYALLAVLVAVALVAAVQLLTNGISGIFSEAVSAF